LCRSLVSEDMARYIVQLTGCDANSSFYGIGKSLAYDKVTRSVAAQLTLLKCGDVDEDIELMRKVIYGDNKSSSMAEAHADKWKAIRRSVLFELLQPAPTLYSCNLFSAPPIVKETSFTMNGSYGWLLLPC